MTVTEHLLTYLEYIYLKSKEMDDFLAEIFKDPLLQTRLDFKTLIDLKFKLNVKGDKSRIAQHKNFDEFYFNNDLHKDLREMKKKFGAKQIEKLGINPKWIMHEKPVPAR